MCAGCTIRNVRVPGQQYYHNIYVTRASQARGIPLLGRSKKNTMCGTGHHTWKRRISLLGYVKIKKKQQEVSVNKLYTSLSKNKTKTNVIYKKRQIRKRRDKFSYEGSLSMDNSFMTAQSERFCRRGQIL